MNIEVTQKDIDMGVPSNSCKCPIAIALKRHLKSDDIKVCLSTEMTDNLDNFVVYFEIDKLRYYSNAFSASTIIRQFVNDFDKWGLTESIKPFNFDFDSIKWHSTITTGA
jgi:hypothetical protein|tara:strand:- start:283 stop:612 length:330 start_codon:yes stop_codon:yes gene_type:complete